jgi:hypothetical protein
MDTKQLLHGEKWPELYALGRGLVKGDGAPMRTVACHGVRGPLEKEREKGVSLWEHPILHAQGSNFRKTELNYFICSCNHTHSHSSDQERIAHIDQNKSNSHAVLVRSPPQKTYSHKIHAISDG